MKLARLRRLEALRSNRPRARLTQRVNESGEEFAARVERAPQVGVVVYRDPVPALAAGRASCVICIPDNGRDP